MFHKLLVAILLLAFISSCKSPEARRAVKSTSGSFIKESAERNKKIYQAEEAAIQKIITNDTIRDYLASPNGFWYYYNVKDTISNPQAKFGDFVTFTYDVQSLNGKEIVSSAENGIQNYKVDQTNQELISGLRDGIKLMKAGETITFLFPSYKAYGYYGIDNKLGTNVPIKSTVTLNTIKTEDN